MVEPHSHPGSDHPRPERLVMPVRLREEDLAVAEPHGAFHVGAPDAQHTRLPAQSHELEDIRQAEVPQVAAQCHGALPFPSSRDDGRLLIESHERHRSISPIPSAASRMS